MSVSERRPRRVACSVSETFSLSFTLSLLCCLSFFFVVCAVKSHRVVYVRIVSLAFVVCFPVHGNFKEMDNFRIICQFSALVSLAFVLSAKFSIQATFFAFDSEFLAHLLFRFFFISLKFESP